jgi:hypothetical protein
MGFTKKSNGLKSCTRTKSLSKLTGERKMMPKLLRRSSKIETISSNMAQATSCCGCKMMMLKNPRTCLRRVRQQAIIIGNTSMRRKFIKMKGGLADPKQQARQLPMVSILIASKSLRIAR